MFGKLKKTINKNTKANNESSFERIIGNSASNPKTNKSIEKAIEINEKKR